MGSMEVGAHNVSERIFAIFTLLLAFVLSAYAVSSITTSMTHLELVTTDQSKKFSELRHFLKHSNISHALAQRIQRSAQTAAETMKNNTRESTVALLAMVSEPLRVEMHYEMNAPGLHHHPFFRMYDRAHTGAMRQICHTGVSKLALHQGDVLFAEGEMPEHPRLFVVLSGTLAYMREGKHLRLLSRGQWACEASLWTLWVHHGAMRVQEECTLLALDAEKFQRSACQFLSTGLNPITYGKEFIRHLNQTPKCDLSDLRDSSFDTEEAASKTFPRCSDNTRTTLIFSGPFANSLLHRTRGARIRNSDFY